MNTATSNGLHLSNWVPVLEQPVFTPRRMRVVSIGAGFANLIFAHKVVYELKAEDWIDHVIYEKNVSLLETDSNLERGLTRIINSTTLEEHGWRIVIQELRATYVHDVSSKYIPSFRR